MIRLATGLCVWAEAAGAVCRQALLLALDVSGSVDSVEYRLQTEGLAHALNRPAVRAALLDAPETPVALAIFEWSSAAHQREIMDWAELRTAADLDAVVTRLVTWPRVPAPETTGLGAALQAADATFARAPRCWRRTLDISGDGKNNDWPLPEDVFAAGALADVTINALVIGSDGPGDEDRRAVQIGELSAYFHAEIIRGPDAFVETALGYDDYARAMERKLLRELGTVRLGWLGPGR